MNPAALAEYEALLAKPRHTKERNMVMTWADELEAKGMRLGLQQGMRDMVLRLLGKRFAPLPESVPQQLSRIESPEELSRLAERILDARSLSELGLAG